MFYNFFPVCGCCFHSPDIALNLNEVYFFIDHAFSIASEKSSTFPKSSRLSPVPFSRWFRALHVGL